MQYKKDRKLSKALALNSIFINTKPEIREIDMKIELPDEWRNDSVTRFIDDAFNNCVATMTNFSKLPILQILVRINDLFFDANKIKCHPIQELLLPLFLGRTHSAYLGAVRLSASGQVVETYMVARGCLENAIYSLFIQDDPVINGEIPNRVKIWLDRAESKATVRKCRQTFTSRNVLTNLANHDKELRRKTLSLYQIAIERGAHPNFAGHLVTSKLSIEGGHIDFLIPGNEEVCKACIQFTVQVGICTLKIFELAYGEKFKSEGLSERLKGDEWILRKL